MISLDELVKLDGVAVACSYTPDGKCTDYRSAMDIPSELADKAAQYIATVTMMFNTLGGSFAQVSGMKWVPQRGWIYSGGDWTCLAGVDTAVFAETAKVDIGKLFEMLAGG